MSSSNLSAAGLKRRLQEQRKEAREKARLVKLKEVERYAEEKALEKLLNEDRVYKSNLINKIAHFAIPFAVDGGQECCFKNISYECQLILEDLGFKFQERDSESASIINLDRKLKALDKKSLKILSSSLRGYLDKIYEVWQDEKILRVYDWYARDHFLFCDHSLIYLKNLLQLLVITRVAPDEFDDEDDYYRLRDQGLDEYRSEKISEILRNISPIIKVYLPYPLNSSRLIALQWGAKSKKEIEDIWFNVNNLNWISSIKGRDFFGIFLKKIDSQISLLKSHIRFNVSIRNDSTSIKFEDGDCITTVLDPSSLNSIFEILEYKVQIVPQKDMSSSYKAKLSWI